MATGKERGFKDWHGSKGFRRSARNYTEPDEITRSPSKPKNTKKWCKGVVGRKHTLALYNKYTFTHNYKCLKCGKEFWGKLNLDNFDMVEMTWEQVNG
ncbi:hypothetical protein SEA_COMRADE_133 [Streptomyces phage Comrade]|uniref:Uncharacterized protein n=3 Tax=Gilsonvirus comrade TaxID=2846395 RepID=A0A345ME45_9CAUD|nr:hypothetical protein HWB84_gp134 [Streptomyces phage Comrade]AXH68826.1 hypothetical protein SEA_SPARKLEGODDESS_135 [Streptomyces phage SparkleGoddess]AXQ63381.1 hypothetical protein SEA_COMRADE_133 [Streptomyces phage Comrade]QQO39801.1 hypothetical protein SEA_BELFORT_137 [Streptomyces phage Belfort]